MAPRIAADVAQRLVDETYPQAISEQKLQPVTEPAIEPRRLEEGKAFGYKARVEVLPLIENVKYDGLEATRAKVSVSPEQNHRALGSTAPFALHFGAAEGRPCLAEG